KKQWLKYTLMGSVLSVVTVLTHLDFSNFFNPATLMDFYASFVDLIEVKAFYALFPFGILAIAAYMIFSEEKYFEHFVIEKVKLYELISLLGALLFVGLLFDAKIISSFFLMWLLSFLGLIPLEWIFRSISRLRSKRNIIYVIYI